MLTDLNFVFKTVSCLASDHFIKQMLYLNGLCIICSSSFHLKNWKTGKKYWKSQEKVREFCQSGKVRTMLLFLAQMEIITHDQSSRKPVKPVIRSVNPYRAYRNYCAFQVTARKCQLFLQLPFYLCHTLLGRRNC